MWLSRTLRLTSVALALIVPLTGCSAPAADAGDPPAATATTAPQPGSGFKFMVLLNRLDHVSYEEFERYFFDVHLPFVLAIPGVRGYIVNLRHPDDEDAPYDGISEFWFDDRESFEQAMASAETAATLEDAATFLHPPQILLVDERVVVARSR